VPAIEPRARCYVDAFIGRAGGGEGEKKKGGGKKGGKGGAAGALLKPRRYRESKKKKRRVKGGGKKRKKERGWQLPCPICGHLSPRDMGSLGKRGGGGPKKKKEGKKGKRGGGRARAPVTQSATRRGLRYAAQFLRLGGREGEQVEGEKKKKKGKKKGGRHHRLRFVGLLLTGSSILERGELGEKKKGGKREEETQAPRVLRCPHI